MKTIRDEITPIQYRAICLLASGQNCTRVAEEAGVTVRTVERWKADPSFKKVLRETIIHAYDAALGELALGANLAIKELIHIIEDEDTPRKTKLGAISLLLTHLSKYKNLILEEKLEAIEASLDDANS
jgi:hypothetical protein